MIPAFPRSFFRKRPSRAFSVFSQLIQNLTRAEEEINKVAIPKRFISCTNFFLTARKNPCAKKKVLQQENNLFCHYVKKFFLGVRNDSSE